MLSARLSKSSHCYKRGSVVQLIVYVFLVSLSIYIWILFGCLGFSDSYLCESFSPESFINSADKNSITNDFAKLIDLNNFTFLINNLVCNNTELILLVLVHSDTRNFEKRNTIRSTWGRNVTDRLKVLFLLGIPKSEDVQKRINEENKTNRDLIQGSFIDSYRNLSYKHVMGLKWTKYFCSGAKYILKSDDDVFYHSTRFLKYVNQELEPLPEKKLIRCLPIYEGRAERTWRSKWRVTWSEYKFRTYPPYCKGFSILYSSDVVVTLYEKAQTAKYFWIDDVFVTGILASFVNYTPSTFGSFEIEPFDFYMSINKFSFKKLYLLGVWNLNAEDMKKLWQISEKDLRQIS